MNDPDGEICVPASEVPAMMMVLFPCGTGSALLPTSVTVWSRLPVSDWTS